MKKSFKINNRLHTGNSHETLQIKQKHIDFQIINYLDHY